MAALFVSAATSFQSVRVEVLLLIDSTSLDWRDALVLASIDDQTGGSVCNVAPVVWAVFPAGFV